VPLKIPRHKARDDKAEICDPGGQINLVKSDKTRDLSSLTRKHALRFFDLSLRLMCITAHPDDECGGFGGALMLAHQRGAETKVVCLTAGSAGSFRGIAQSEQELAALRRKEFAASLHVLGVTHGEVLDYPDGALASQNFVAVTTALVERMRRFRPHIVLTFGGDGNVNQHPDHTMACCFTTAAFHWAGREKFAAAGLLPYRPQKLYYGVAPFLAYANAEEARTIAMMPATLSLDVEHLKSKKIEAFMQHTTQAELLAKVRVVFEETGGEEKYLLAATRSFRSSPLETDMFSGVEEEIG
jgi:LmbE family N-acetylglucosaminyl deacetylase